jgi:hypothetical protein
MKKVTQERIERRLFINPMHRKKRDTDTTVKIEILSHPKDTRKKVTQTSIGRRLSIVLKSQIAS